jgi:hypothetical protein
LSHPKSTKRAGAGMLDLSSRRAFVFQQLLDVVFEQFILQLKFGLGWDASKYKHRTRL